MKKFLKAVSLTLVLSTFLMAFAACSDGGEETKGEENKNTFKVTEDYLIVRENDKSVIEIAKTFKKDIESETGLSLKVKDDWVKDPSEIPAKEILLGNCERDESKAVYEKLGENEWTVMAAGEKIVIAGESTRALCDAVDYFIATYVEGKDAVEMGQNAVNNGKTKLVYFTWDEGEVISTGINGGYPRLYALSDGTMLLGYDGMYVSRSTDNGLTWSKGVHASSASHLGTANAAFFQDDKGTVYLGYRSVYKKGSAQHTDLQIAYSTDNGMTWKHHSTLYENVEPTGAFKGVWEPHFGMMNGKLTCFYANDSTNLITDYQYIEYKQWDEEKKEWNNRTVVCDGVANQSRDGMPVWQQLSTGEYVCVVEAFNKDDGNRFAVKLTWSEDGVKWTTPITVMRAEKAGTACAAPYIVELPTGQLVISCQTNEKSPSGENYIMSTVISDGTPVRYLTEDNFSAHDYPYGTSPKDFMMTGMWNGMYVYNGYIFTCSITNAGIKINRFKFEGKEQ